MVEMEEVRVQGSLKEREREAVESDQLGEDELEIGMSMRLGMCVIGL